MKAILSIIILLCASCGSVQQINGVRIKHKPTVDGRQKFYCTVAAVAGVGLATHFIKPVKNK